MSEYDDIAKAITGDPSAESKFTSCKKVSYIENMINALGDKKDFIKSVKSDFQRTLTTLERANRSDKLKVYKDIYKTQKAIEKATPEQLPKLEARMETLRRIEDNIPSVKIERSVLDAHNDYQLRMSQHMFAISEQLRNLDIDSNEDKVLQQILGIKNENLTTDYLLGESVKGEKLDKSFLKDIEEHGIDAYVKGTKSTGGSILDQYIKDRGMEGVKKVYVIAKAFRQAGIAAGLAPEKFLQNYISKIDSFLNASSDQLVKRLSNKGLIDNAKAFYEQQRVDKLFNPNEKSIKETLNIYLNTVRRKIQQPYINNLIEIRYDPNNGLDKVETDALESLILNLKDAKTKQLAIERIAGGVQKTFYRASLINNIGSSINNLTTIPNIMMSKFGIRNTYTAFREAFQPSKVNDLLDAFAIGSHEDAITVFNTSFVDASQIEKGLKYDLFNRSEMFSIRVSGIAGLSKHFGGIDQLYKKLDSLDGLDSATKQKELIRLGTIAKKASMDTVFNNVIGNISPMDARAGRIYSSMTSFLRHPLREGNFIWKEATLRPREEAIETLTKYFTAKALLVGGSLPFLFIPDPIMNYLDSKFPEVRKNMQGIGEVLDAFALPKRLFGMAGIDLSKSQDIMYWWEPLSFIIPIKGTGREDVPIIRYFSSLASAGRRVAKGEASSKDWWTMLTSFTLAPMFLGGQGGAITIGNIPIGANQLKKTGEAITSLFTGKSEFFGVETDLKEFKDYRDAFARIYATGTPTTVKIMNAKTRQSGNYRTYLLGLASKGQIDPKTFDEFSEALGGKKKAIDSLRRSFKNETKNSKDNSIKMKGNMALNAYI